MRSRRARQRLTCFYCLTPTDGKGNVDLNPYYWRCPACEQWNRRDTRGEIIPDPAAQNVFANHSSWQRRASLPDNSFPPGTPWSPFCTQCVTNQKLIVEMLANYLPDETDPSYPAALESIPAYRADLERRYPPLCEDCRPRVEEALRKHNNDAMSEIRASMVVSGSSTPNNASLKTRTKERGQMQRWEMRVWKARGLAWALGLILSVARCIRSLAHPSEVPQGYNANLEVMVTIASVLWTTWNPKWYRHRTYVVAGVPIHTRGLYSWTLLQLTIYAIRLLLSLSYLHIWPSVLPYTPTFYRTLGAINLLADTLLNYAAYTTISIKKIPLTNRTLPPLGPAPPKQSFYENAFDTLRLSDSPQYTPSKPRSAPQTPAAFSPTRAASSYNAHMLRPGILQGAAITPELSSPRIPSTPPLAGSSVATDDDAAPMDIDPPVFQTTSYDLQMKPQTFPPRYTATGLEDLLSSWNLNDPTPPQPRINGVGGGWQEVGLLELLESVALCVGWVTGQMRALQIAWACVAVVGIYKLGQQQRLGSAVAAGTALLRAALPLPVLATSLDISPRMEALLWDAASAAVILAARFSFRKV